MAKTTKRTTASAGTGRSSKPGSAGNRHGTGSNKRKSRSRGRTSKKYKQQIRRKRMIAMMMLIMVAVVGAIIGILAASMCVVAGEDDKRSGRK